MIRPALGAGRILGGAEEVLSFGLRLSFGLDDAAMIPPTLSTRRDQLLTLRRGAHQFDQKSGFYDAFTSSRLMHSLHTILRLSFFSFSFVLCIS